MDAGPSLPAAGGHLGPEHTTRRPHHPRGLNKQPRDLPLPGALHKAMGTRTPARKPSSTFFPSLALTVTRTFKP